MSAEPILGQVMPFSGGVIPRGWALCNGAILAIQTNAALFSLLGTAYGGDGTRTFGLPDLRGRAILGSTGGTGNYPAGMLSGTPSVTLNLSQLPPHTHPLQASTVAGSARGSAPANAIYGTNGAPSGNPTKIFAEAGSQETQLAIGTNIQNEGGNAPHNNMQPYLAISYLIAMAGTYPSRS